MRFPKIPVVVLLATLASACVPATPKPQPSSPTVAKVSPTARAATATTAAPQGPGCYYVWSSQDLPALSQELDRRLQATDPSMNGSAYAFGEDCVAEDGARTFSAMETDFRIQVRVDDLTDRERMGNAIRNAMAVVGKLPPSQLQGPRSGRAEFAFMSLGSDALRLNVDIASYESIAAGLHGAGLFDALQSAP